MLFIFWLALSILFGSIAQWIVCHCGFSVNCSCAFLYIALGRFFCIYFFLLWSKLMHSYDLSNRSISNCHTYNVLIICTLTKSEWERERKSDSDKNDMHSLWINCELFYQSSSGIVITVSTTILPEWNFSIRTICFWTSQLLWITSIHKEAADFSYAVEFINNFFFFSRNFKCTLIESQQKNSFAGVELFFLPGNGRFW